MIGALEFIGGTTLLGWRVLKLLVRGKVNFALLLEQMSLLGVNSIPICMLVLAFAGSVFTLILASELAKRAASSLIGGLLLEFLLREFIPLFTGVVLSGKIGAAITSEIGTMKISEQLDAMRALSVDPDWYLTLPRVLAGLLMVPVIAIFAGYSGWYAGFLVAQQEVGLNYATFASSVQTMVGVKDFNICLVKSIVFIIVIVLTACYMGYRVSGGAAEVGRAVTNCVVVCMVLLFAMDFVLTWVLPRIL
ncbi:ABC transporter permease [bacterium]|nr:ABC transporter permease [bacterium]